MKEEQERTALLFMLEDLERSRKKIEQAHHEWLDAMDAIHDPIFMHDKDYRIMRCNRAYAERAGMTIKEVLGKLYWEVFPKLDGPLAHCCKALQAEEEEEIQIASGEVFVSRSFSVRNGDGSYLYSLHVMEDITERKRAEHRKELEESRLRASLRIGRMLCADDKAILDFALEEGIRLTDSRYGFIGSLNEDESVMTTHVWSKEVMAACAVEHAPIVFPVATAGIWAEPQRTRQPFILNDYAQQSHPRKHGTPPEGHVEIRRYLGVPVFDGERITMIAAMANKAQEYTETDAAALSALMGEAWRVIQRNRAEQAVLHANRAFKTLSACNHELVHATDEGQLLQAMCRIIVESGGYRMAWVGYVQQDAEKTVRPMAHSGFGADYLDTAHITWADSVCGRGPTGRAIRSGTAQFARDISTDPDFAPWREQAMKQGFAASIALPLRSDNEVFGSLNIYAAEKDAFEQGEVALLEEMADDLSFGIHTLRLRQEQQRTAEQVRVGLAGTVQAIAAMVEMRDPYTAGHQRRVAQLAAAIAVEMGLPEEQVRGIHLAGTIHDLGKIQTPAEILSKPGKLSATEFNLIKDHPRNGYEILKDIAFPWPIAQMVLQHHEKLDGTGYPQGLKGNDILLEARIMTVADVVEAMSSHRPYRPGLGLDVALTEIGKGRGTHYDPQVVDVCVRLFWEKGFKFV